MYWEVCSAVDYRNTKCIGRFAQQLSIGIGRFAQQLSIETQNVLGGLLSS